MTTTRAGCSPGSCRAADTGCHDGVERPMAFFRINPAPD
jgi:hypothetical protein